MHTGELEFVIPLPGDFLAPYRPSVGTEMTNKLYTSYQWFWIDFYLWDEILIKGGQDPIQNHDICSVDHQTHPLADTQYKLYTLESMPFDQSELIWNIKQ